MAKYQWNLSELENNLAFLEQIYESEKNEEVRETIKSSIDIYKNMINLSNSEIRQDNDILNDNLKYDSFDNLIDEQISSYQNNDTVILNNILQSYLPFSDSYRSNFILKEVFINATDEELVTIAEEFIKKMVPSSIKGDFISVINDHDSIQFSYNKHEASYSGITLFEPIFNKKYIFISKSGMLVDLVTLPHELFHYFFNDSTVGEIINYNMYYTTEIEGGFANILFGDYFYNTAYQQNNYFNGHFLELFHSGISEMVVRNTFLSTIKGNKKFKFNKFNKELKYWGVLPFTDVNEISDYLINPLEINMKYTLGYLVGIDLYYIYQSDPEFAFHLLKNIRYIIREDDVIGLLRKNHITFMDDGYENLKKYVKKIERQN